MRLFHRLSFLSYRQGSLLGSIGNCGAHRDSPQIGLTTTVLALSLHFGV